MIKKRKCRADLVFSVQNVKKCCVSLTSIFNAQTQLQCSSDVKSNSGDDLWRHRCSLAKLLTTALVLCMKSCPAQLCFEAAIAQDREISWPAVCFKDELYVFNLHLWFLSGVHWMVYFLDLVFLVWVSCCVSASCTVLAFSKGEWSVQCIPKTCGLWWSY